MMKKLFLRKILVTLLSTSVALAPAAPGYADYVYKKHISNVAPTDATPVTPPDNGSAAGGPSSSTLSFAPGPVIGQSQTKSVQYVNTGNKNLTFNAAPSLTGSSAYTLSSDCGAALAETVALVLFT